MRTAANIKNEMRNMELQYDNLFSVPELAAKWNALSAELRALPGKPYNRASQHAEMTSAAIRKEVAAIRFLRSNGADAAGRLSELCRIWPHYRAARRALVQA